MQLPKKDSTHVRYVPVAKRDTGVELSAADTRNTLRELRLCTSIESMGWRLTIEFIILPSRSSEVSATVGETMATLIVPDRRPRSPFARRIKSAAVSSNFKTSGSSAAPARVNVSPLCLRSNSAIPSSFSRALI
jgi:hypothetical protein